MKSKGREAAPFEIRYRNGRGPEKLKADAVIDVSGTWFSPNPSGASGLPAIGEPRLSARIAYGMPDVIGGHRKSIWNELRSWLDRVRGHAPSSTLIGQAATIVVGCVAVCCGGHHDKDAKHHSAPTVAPATTNAADHVARERSDHAQSDSGCCGNAKVRN